MPAYRIIALLIDEQRDQLMAALAGRTGALPFLLDLSAKGRIATHQAPWSPRLQPWSCTSKAEALDSGPVRGGRNDDQGPPGLASLLVTSQEQVNPKSTDGHR